MAEGGARASGRGRRRRARELAVRAVYAWLVSGATVTDLLEQARGAEEYPEADPVYLEELVSGVTASGEELHALLAPLLDRPASQLSPVERAILLCATLELHTRLEIPFRVVINEAVELAKVYGGTEGHRFVNGVLDRLAPSLRGPEVPQRGPAT